MDSLKSSLRSIIRALFYEGFLSLSYLFRWGLMVRIRTPTHVVRGANYWTMGKSPKVTAFYIIDDWIIELIQVNSLTIELCSQDQNDQPKNGASLLSYCWFTLIQFLIFEAHIVVSRSDNVCTIAFGYACLFL